MGPLKNIRHERFAQNVVSGLSLAAAYVAARGTRRLVPTQTLPV
jgi:hypothetical protein